MILVRCLCLDYLQHPDCIVLPIHFELRFDGFDLLLYAVGIEKWLVEVARHHVQGFLKAWIADFEGVVGALKLCEGIAVASILWNVVGVCTFLRIVLTAHKYHVLYRE